MPETRQNRLFRPTDYALGTGQEPSPYAVSGLDNRMAQAETGGKNPLCLVEKRAEQAHKPSIHPVNRDQGMATILSPKRLICAPPCSRTPPTAWGWSSRNLVNPTACR